MNIEHEQKSLTLRVTMTNQLAVAAIKSCSACRTTMNQYCARGENMHGQHVIAFCVTEGHLPPEAHPTLVLQFNLNLANGYRETCNRLSSTDCNDGTAHAVQLWLCPAGNILIEATVSPATVANHLSREITPRKSEWPRRWHRGFPRCC